MAANGCPGARGVRASGISRERERHAFGRRHAIGHRRTCPSRRNGGGARRTCSLTVLNRSGDSTLAWDASNDAMVMREVIQRKLDEGFAFFVLRKRMGGLLPDRRERVTDVEAAMASRRLVMADEVLASVVGKDVHLVPSPSREPLRDGDAEQSRTRA